MLGLVRPLVFAVALCAAQHAAAVTPGQIDDFEDGTTADWRIGLSGPGEPVNVPTGGPAGDGDAYLLLTANGAAGPGAKLVAINTEQWAGDYRAARVVAIEMQLANLSATDLALSRSRTPPSCASTTRRARRFPDPRSPHNSPWTTSARRPRRRAPQRRAQR